MSNSPEKTAATRADLETISCHWFGSNNAAPALDSIVREVAAYRAGTRQQHSPSVRRRKLESLQSAAQKLRHHPTDLDTGTKLALFGRAPDLAPSSVNGPIPVRSIYSDVIPPEPREDAHDILSNPPINASDAEVRTALRQFFVREQKG